MLHNEKLFQEIGLRPNDNLDPCFYCSQPVTPPWIEWIGHTTICLHPQCCMELVIRLVRDLHQHECEDHRECKFLPEKNLPVKNF